MFVFLVILQHHPTLVLALVVNHLHHCSLLAFKNIFDTLQSVDVLSALDSNIGSLDVFWEHFLPTYLLKTPPLALRQPEDFTGIPQEPSCHIIDTQVQLKSGSNVSCRTKICCFFGHDRLRDYPTVHNIPQPRDMLKHAWVKSTYQHVSHTLLPPGHAQREAEQEKESTNRRLKTREINIRPEVCAAASK